MKIYTLIAISVAVLLFDACQPRQQEITVGVWKIEKIELYKDDKFNKIIDTSCQYWKFNEGKSRIKIFSSSMQSELAIRMHNSSFSSYDSSGEEIDEYFIRSLSGSRMELSSGQQEGNSGYTIYYYLDKVNDSTAEKIVPAKE